MAIVIRKSQIKPQIPKLLSAIDKKVSDPLDSLRMQRQQQMRLTRALDTSAANDSRYIFGELLGEGGAGSVVKAYDTLLEMDVAIKILAPRMYSDSQALKALKDEVRITLGLVHKHILRIYNMEKVGSNYLIVMEYLKGESVLQMLQRSPDGLTLNFTVELIRIAASALEYAHRHDVLHMDITPGNIFLTDDGIVKVIDFGIAKMTGGNTAESGDTIVATPDYMSPEQIRGDALDCRTDIYSLGVLTYQMLTGYVVNAADASVEDIAFRPHPPISGLSESLAYVIEKATAFNPDDRYSSMTDFAADLVAAADIT